MTRRSLLPCISAVFLLVTSGCGPSSTKGPSEEAERYAATLCEAIQDCGCVQRFDSFAACEDVLVERFDGALDGDLHVASACFDQVMIAVAECAPPPQVSGIDACDVLRGDKQLGDSCSHHYELAVNVNECGDGLRCTGVACVRDGEQGQPPPSKDEGQACVNENPTPCGVVSIYCGFDEVCHAAAEIGEPCDHPLGCELMAEDQFLY